MVEQLQSRAICQRRNIVPLMSLEPGTKLAHYEILDLIGKGGMGEVYRARDSKLGRDVAIKVLPDEFSQDEERVARFKREAKVLASLNHPNIASIYGLEHSKGIHYLVLEMVEGETLAERIARGPIPVDEALAIADEIAEALEEAHERGIIHRDLKPANIKQTPDDKVKVLDYGLAKAFVDETADVDSSLSPTVTRDATRAGTIMGTAAYMSPEQAKGKRVDKRADIFAFGAVLYEMLTGKKAFTGEGISEILAAVIKSEPDWNALPSETPRKVHVLLKRCLQKDRSARLRDIGDAKLLVEDAAPRAEAPPRSIPVVAIALVVLGALGLGAWVGTRVGSNASTGTNAAPLRVRIPLPPDTLLGGFGSTVVAISPDGTKVAVVGNDGEERLFILDLTDGSSRLVPDSATAEGPFFSPDGQWVGFATGTRGRRTATGELRKVSVEGGLPQKIVDIDDYFGASWGDDGFIYYVERVDRGLSKIASAGGTRESVADAWLLRPTVLPGAHAAVAEGDMLGNLLLVDLSTGEVTDLELQGTTPRFARSGHLVYSSLDRQRLMAVPFDPNQRVATGAPMALIDDLALSRHQAGVFDVSNDGALLYATGFVRNSERELSELLKVNRSGAAEPLGFESDLFREISVSRDGRRLVTTTANNRIWNHDLERGSRVVLSETGARSPQWTPDGTRIIYSTNTVVLHWRDADGTGTQTKLLDLPGEQYAGSLTPDGSTLAFYYSNWEGAGAFDIYLMEMTGEAEPQVLISTTANELHPQISPDGKWLAYASSESGQFEVYAQAFPTLGEKIPLSRDGGLQPRWSANGRELFYQNGDAIFVVNVGGGERLEPGPPQLLYEADGIQSYDVLPSGEIIVVQRIAGGGRHTELELILNWFTELERLVPIDK